MRKKKLSLRRKKLLVLLVALMLVMSSILTACNSHELTTTTEVKEENVVDEVNVEKVVEETEEIVQKQVADEVMKEEVVDEEEYTTQEEKPQNINEWVESFDTDEPKLTIWNDTTKEGSIIENGQKYVLKEGDILVVCIKEKESALMFESSISQKDFRSYGTSEYKVFEFKKQLLEETVFGFTITIAGIDYSFSITLISENATNNTEVSESTSMTGIDWANSLDYEEPKLIAWNDEIGTKEVIEDGGEYKLQEGDKIALYHPAGNLIMAISPTDFVESLIPTPTFEVINYLLPNESQTINLEIDIMDDEDNSITCNYVITTP